MSKVTLTQEDVAEARRILLECSSSALLSGRDKEARAAFEDRCSIYSRIVEAAGLLLGDLPGAPAQASHEPVRPDILERLTYHAYERDDLTVSECLDVLTSCWAKVRGRTERQLVMQILALLAGAPAKSSDVGGSKAFAQYMAECDEYSIVPDVAGAFNWAWTYAPRALPDEGDYHGLDTPERVCFYEQDFYVLSNFSSFSVQWCGMMFPTSEHAYHWEKFRSEIAGESDNDRFQREALADSIRRSPSAHDAFKTAERWKGMRRRDWDQVKEGIMRSILRAKVNQHPYVRYKLLATGDRELVENSWRDDFWGWGPHRNGKNALGKLWMEIRAELRAETKEAQ